MASELKTHSTTYNQMTMCNAVKLDMYFEASGLASTDLLSACDPYLVVSVMNAFNKYEEVGRTEVKKNQEHPVWTTPITVDYVFSEHQKIKFDIYDDDGKDKADFLGSVESEVSQLISNHIKDYSFGSGGILSVRSEKNDNSNNEVYFDVKCENLAKMDLFSNSDGVLRLYKQINTTNESSSAWSMIYESEMIKKNKNPHWAPFKLPLGVVCGGDELRDIKFSVWDKDGDDDYDFIGEFVTTLRDLQRGEVVYNLVDDNKRSKSRGKLIFDDVKMLVIPSFTDYVRAGMGITVEFAVDFTASNGDPSDPMSHHYCLAGENSYEKTIRSIGNVLLPYDTDKIISLYGFGGVFDDSRRVSHCQLLGECKGLDTLCNTYKHTVNNVVLSGNTYFRELLETVMITAQQREKSSYTVLVILTDGAIHDKKHVSDLLKQCKFLPLSVIVVGVGNADFSIMENLDNDDSCDRDIVQFVKYNTYKNNTRLLANEVLRELPTQVEQFTKLRRLSPEYYSNNVLGVN